VDNKKNSPLNLLEEMRHRLSTADSLRQKMEERLRHLNPAGPNPDTTPGKEDEEPGDDEQR
jgi:hypothetical protein